MKILAEVNKLNNEEFQKKSSRRKVFEEEEKEKLIPLPYPRYQLAEWRTARFIKLSYPSEPHVLLSPYEYVQSQVDVRISKTN